MPKQTNTLETQTRIRVTLSGSGGELASERFHKQESEQANTLQIREIVKGWDLAPGDTVTITEEG